MKKNNLLLSAVLCTLMVFAMVFGAYADETIATVNGTPIDASQFKEMSTFVRYQYINNYYQYLQMYNAYGIPYDDLNAAFTEMLGESGAEEIANAAIEQLVYNRALDLEDEKNGLDISDDEIYEREKEMFGYEDPAEDADDFLGLESLNMEPLFDEDPYAEFKDYVKNYVETYYDGYISPNFFKDYTKHLLIEEALFDKVLEDMVFEEEMVSARHILVDSREEAEEIIAQLHDGGDWEAIAAERSIDPGTKDAGGSLGWFGRGTMVEPFENAAFALEPGEMTEEPVESDYGFHIIASDGKEIRPMEGSSLEDAKNAAYSKWYEDLLSQYDVVVSDAWKDYYELYPEFTAYVEPEA